MKPLEGLRVIDLSRVLSGPFCTMNMADMGAEVIKVEMPPHGDDTRQWGPPFLNGESTYFLSVNRGKKSITLNLKDPRGKTLLHRLLETADVLVENFRPGTLQRLGFGQSQLEPLYPRLIYATISGYGLTGPRAKEPGYDAIIQGESGLMSVSGFADGPPTKMGASIADILAGMYAFQGILLALLQRQQTGRGTLVDAGLLDSTVSVMTYQSAIYFATGSNPRRMGNRHPSITPYEPYMAQDGYFIVAVGNASQWKRFLDAVGLEGLAPDARFETMAGRLEHHQALETILGERFRQRKAADWIEALRAAGVPCGLIRDMDQVFADPQLEVRDMVLTHEHPVAGTVRSVGNPVKISGVSHSAQCPAPTLGQHNHDVFVTLLGLREEEVRTLQQDQVI